jgi:hypothetical protein
MLFCKNFDELVNFFDESPYSFDERFFAIVGKKIRGANVRPEKAPKPTLKPSKPL